MLERHDLSRAAVLVDLLESVPGLLGGLARHESRQVVVLHSHDDHGKGLFVVGLASLGAVGPQVLGDEQAFGSDGPGRVVVDIELGVGADLLGVDRHDVRYLQWPLGAERGAIARSRLPCSAGLTHSWH